MFDDDGDDDDDDVDADGDGDDDDGGGGDDDDALPVVVAVPGKAQAFAVYIYIWDSQYFQPTLYWWCWIYVISDWYLSPCKASYFSKSTTNSRLTFLGCLKVPRVERFLLSQIMMVLGRS